MLVLAALTACAGGSNESDPTQSRMPNLDSDALIAAIDCAVGVDPFDLEWRDSLPRLNDAEILWAAYCTGDPLSAVEYEGDLHELADLLSRPDEVKDFPEGTGCNDDYQVQPNLWVVTADGDLIQPRWPLDACKHLLPPVPEVLPV